MPPMDQRRRSYPAALRVSRTIPSRPAGLRLTRVMGTFRMIESSVKINDELCTTTFMGR